MCDCFTVYTRVWSHVRVYVGLDLKVYRISEYR